MPTRHLTTLLVAVVLAASCAYDSDPATPDELESRDFKELVRDVRANRPESTAPDIDQATSECLWDALLAQVGAGVLTTLDFALWTSDVDRRGPAAEVARQIMEEGVC